MNDLPAIVVFQDVVELLMTLSQTSKGQKFWYREVTWFPGRETSVK